MSEKEKNIFKKKSRKILSLPSFRKSKKLNQIKEDVCLDIKDDNKPQSNHGSNNSLPSLGLDATVSLDSPRKENTGLIEKLDIFDESQGTSTPNSERRSFSNLRSAYLDNPDIIRNAVSPGARRLGLGGSNNLSTDSGIDCSILLSEKGSPERFQEFTRREAEKIRLEHLQSINNSLVTKVQSEQAENVIGAIANAENEATVENSDSSSNIAGTNALQEQIEQTKEHINLLSELRSVLEQKLEACNIGGNATGNDFEEEPTDETVKNENKADIHVETNNTMNLPGSSGDLNEGNDRDSLTHGHSSRSGASESFNLYLHTNKTDERKSEEARMRLENSVGSFANSLLIDSPHLIVSPTPVISAASTANHRILPSTPSPARLYVNEKSAFAKCKSLKRSVSDVGKGLLGKLRQKKKNVDETKCDITCNATETNDTSVLQPLMRDKETELGKKEDGKDYLTFSAHLETSLLCGNGETNDLEYDTPSISWEMTDINTSIENSYENDSLQSEHSHSFGDTSSIHYMSNIDSQVRDNINHSQGSISAIQELTSSICEMTSKLKLTPSQRSSANSIDCMCNCKNRSESPHCCDRSKTPSPSNLDLSENFNLICYKDDLNMKVGSDLSVSNGVKKCDSNTQANTGDIDITECGAETKKELPNEVTPGEMSNGEAHTEMESNISKVKEDEIEIVYEETDSLLESNSSDLLKSKSKTTIERQMPVPEVYGAKKYNRDGKKQLFHDNGLCADIKEDWLCCDTEDESSDDSYLSSCSGCSSEDCLSRNREKKRLNVRTDSSSDDTSPTDFNTYSSDKSSDSECSSLDYTPEKMTWKNASYGIADLEESPYSVSYTELNEDGLESSSISKFQRHLRLQLNSPQSNFPSPEVNFMPHCISKTPASSPVINFNDHLVDSPEQTHKSAAPTYRSDGCRRKDTYVNLSPEHLSTMPFHSSHKMDKMADYSRSESDLNISNSSLLSKGTRLSESVLNASELQYIRERKQPDIIKDVIDSPVGPLDLSMKKEQKDSLGITSKKKSALWIDKHVGQVFSPAKIVRHKNRNISEIDLCRNILDSYTSEADESSFEPDFESSFSNSLNCSVTGAVSFNSSLNCSNTFNASLNSSSVLEPGSDDDSMLQYGTYVAPRQPKKETNVDDFSTTVVSSCYSAKAKTRKLQGGHSGSILHVPTDFQDSKASVAASGQPRSSHNKWRTSLRGRPYNPAQYQSGRRRHASLPTEDNKADILCGEQERLGINNRIETIDLEHDNLADSGNQINTSLRVKGRRETRDQVQNDPETLVSQKKERVKVRKETRDEVRNDTETHVSQKEERVRVKGRRETGDHFQNYSEVANTQREAGARVKGRRETRDMVLKDRTNTEKQQVPQLQSKMSSELKKSLPMMHQADGKENEKCADVTDHRFDQLTILHTAHNGKRKVRCLSVYEAQSIVKHYPPPKQASAISWGQTLSEMDLSRHTPRKTPIKTKPILLQNKNAYPYEDDTPSPIVLTRLRRSKSLSKKFKNWPW